VTVLAASVNEEIADFLGSLLFVYILLLIAHIIVSLVLSLGVRIPYSRWFDAVTNFLRDVSEPYLRPWRKIIPMIGPLDLSPMVAILALQIVGGIFIGIIRG
jgi:uncharacterized protein YggT (Ycf19 family)